MLFTYDNIYNITRMFALSAVGEGKCIDLILNYYLHS